MDKIGRAVAYTTDMQNQGKEYHFIIDISELYMIREVASSFVKIGEEPVGFNLKRKVCNLLYDADLEQETRDVQVDHLLKDVNVDLDSLITEEIEASSDS